MTEDGYEKIGGEYKEAGFKLSIGAISIRVYRNGFEFRTGFSAYVNTKPFWSRRKQKKLDPIEILIGCLYNTRLNR